MAKKQASIPQVNAEAPWWAQVARNRGEVARFVKVPFGSTIAELSKIYSGVMRVFAPRPDFTPKISQLVRYCIYDGYKISPEFLFLTKDGNGNLVYASNLEKGFHIWGPRPCFKQILICQIENEHDTWIEQTADSIVLFED